jgi:hypothetical protein
VRVATLLHENVSHPTVCATSDGERDKNPETAVTIGVLDGRTVGMTAAVV